jgi:hypothetical protein
MDEAEPLVEPDGVGQGTVGLEEEQLGADATRARASERDTDGSVSVEKTDGRRRVSSCGG